MLRSLLCGLLLTSLPMLFEGQEQKLSPAAVPAPVSAAATKRFPKARVSGWSKETEDGKTTYEASVSDSTGKRDAVFGEDGALLAIEQGIALSDLPVEVKNAVTAKYPGAVLRKAEKITHDGGSVDYEVDLAKASHKEVTLSSTGKILKEE